MTGSWLIEQSGTHADVHVLPAGEAGLHIRSLDCWCNPDSETLPVVCGCNQWMTTHHSLDGRERHE